MMEEFELGTPALVCRWRLAARTLPLENRHLRALSQRHVAGKAVSTGLVAWAKQHIEWTLAEGAADQPDGVLMLVMDERGRAAMTVGPYEELPDRSLAELADRALAARREAAVTGVSPESLWVVRNGALVWGAEPDELASGAASLVVDLAHTLGISVERAPRLADAARAGEVALDEALLVSDEHGPVAADGLGGPVAERLARGYATLLERATRRPLGA